MLARYVPAPGEGKALSCYQLRHPELLKASCSGTKAFIRAPCPNHGPFEAAGEGTIFLDEIGELGLNLQVKLLRALEERSFEPVGSARPVPLRARIMGSTNCDLAALIREKRFRLDLYYRLKGFAVTIPPLRERREDIEPLLAHFLERYRRRYGKAGVEISRRAVRYLKGYPWPGMCAS
jgi:transcriptional regulator with PAS, ATPase and Fis domain